MSLMLYHHNSSVCAAKVRIALTEKCLDWDDRLMKLDGDQLDPAYLRLNPAAVVPTLVHDGAVIVESNIILEYLDDAFPSPSLRPDDAVSRARMRLWMGELEQGEKGVHKATSLLTYAIAYRHHLIAEAGGEKQDRLTAYMERYMNPLSREWLEPAVLHGTASDRFKSAIARMNRLCGDFEAWLVQEHWLAGREYSLADIAFTPYIIRLDLLCLSALWSERPNLAAWYKRLLARPSTSEVWDWYHPDYIGTLRAKGAEHRTESETILTDIRGKGG